MTRSENLMMFAHVIREISLLADRLAYRRSSQYAAKRRLACGWSAVTERPRDVVDHWNSVEYESLAANGTETQLVLMDWLLTVVPQYHTTEASPSHHAWYKHNYFAPGGVRSIVMSMSVCPLA